MRAPVAKLKPELKLGAEPKKIAILGVLVAIAIGAYFYNSSDSPSSSGSTAPTPSSTATAPAPIVRPTLTRPVTRQSIARNSTGQSRGVALQEFRPTLKPKDPIDPSKIDPTLRLNLLTRVKNVNLQGVGRSLFDFSAAPPPKVEIAKVKPIIPGKTTSAGVIGPVQPKPPAPAVPPPPAPIPLKFYGFTNALRQGPKRAFFLEGEDIFVAAEGDVIKNRYKVVRIGVNSAVVEDTTDKHQQTLPLEAEQVSG